MTSIKRYFLMFLALLIFIIAITNNSTVDAASRTPLSSNQQQFIASVRQSVNQVNQEVLVKRERLKSNYQTWQANKSLPKAEQQWLQTLAKQQQMKSFSVHHQLDWQELMSRVDIVPVSLTLAQAIDESGWGRSRFAQQGNNLFGRWCYTRGCGIVPLQRRAGSTHEVKKYATRLASVRDYVHNINSNSAYQQLRSVRATMRGRHQSLDGFALANGLLRYSSRGYAYVADIQGIIKKYHLQ